MVAKRDQQMSVEDFLALDREKLDEKYEFRYYPLVPTEMTDVINF